MAKKLMKGCEAIGEAAIRAQCKLFFGYPITPQNEIPEYLSRRLPEVGGTFVQAESEVAASHMIYGAAGAGERVFTSSSSPGISLMTEALSYLAGAELPVVIVNIVRAGPGLGGLQPSQGDYFQATRGGGHGDYHCIVLAPWSVQEAADLMQDAFDLADYYRTPVMVVGDGLIGQMMEPCEFRDDRQPCKPLPAKDWATQGFDGSRPRAVINSLFLDPEPCEVHNQKLSAKYELIKKDEPRVHLQGVEPDLDTLVIAYGTVARVVSSALPVLRAEGQKVGLLRPVTLFPFPTKAVQEAALFAKRVLVVELSTGQMIEDVRLALAEGKGPSIHFLGRQGGMLISPDLVVRKVTELSGLIPSLQKRGDAA